MTQSKNTHILADKQMSYYVNLVQYLCFEKSYMSENHHQTDQFTQQKVLNTYELINIFRICL